MIINDLIKLMQDINIKVIPENENLKKSLILMNNKKIEDSKC